MNTIVKRTLTILMAVLMLSVTLLGTVACADLGQNAGETTASNGSGENVESESIAAYGSLEKQKFGREFSILTREDLIEDMEIKKVTGDTLDDLLYDRNVAVSEDYDITFEYFTEDDLHALNSKLMTQATSGVDDYDMYIGHKFSFNTNAKQNHCYNLNKIEALRLDQPWWDQNCYDNLTIDGKTFLMTGDINPSSMRISSCMIVNKELMKDLQKDMNALNELTENGGWTLDVLYDYTANVTRDLNGDQQINYQDDQYGLTSWMMDVPFSLYYGAGSNFVNIVNGQPEPAANAAERITDIYAKIYEIMIENRAYMVTDSNIWSSCYDVFLEGRALFCDITLGKITTYIVNANMEYEYGILPMPKFDTNQEEYLSFVNGASGFAMVSYSEQDPEFVGTIMEAMASYNYDNVTPKMFEVVTKLQAAQDPESAAMVDRIIYNRIYDPAYFFDLEISNLVLNNLKNKSESISSSLRTSIQKLRVKDIPDLLESYGKCDIDD